MAPDLTDRIKNGANLAGRYIEMRMRRVYLNMRTEGIKALSKQIRCCSVEGENGTKTISVDANLFENGARQIRFRLKTDLGGRGLSDLSNDDGDARDAAKKRVNLYFTLEFHSCIDLFSAAELTRAMNSKLKYEN